MYHRNMQYQVSLVVSILAIMVFIPSISFALTPQQKIQYITAAIKGAKESVQKKKKGEARMALLSVLTEIQSLSPASGQSPVKELFADYMTARNMAWSDAPPQLTSQALQLFLSTFQEQKSELLRFSRDLNMDSLPNGTKDYYRKIADVLAQRQPAYSKLGDLSMVSPPPEQLLGNQQVFMKLFKEQIPKMYFNVTFGPAIAAGHAQQRVIPENIKNAETFVSESKESKDPSFIWSKIGDAQEAVDLCESIEAVLKEEINVSVLTQKIPGIKNNIQAENKRAQVLYDKQIDSNRMPVGVTWNDGNDKEIRRQIQAAYQTAFPDEKILKIALQSGGFGERWESWWDKDTLYSGYFGYLKAAIAGRQKNGDCRVFKKWFRKDLKADGSWSPLYFHKTINSYLIREKNI